MWKEAGLSRSSISRANKQLHAEFEAWRRRDLSKVKVLYLFLDGVNERVRFGSSEKEGILAVHAILEDGQRELLALELGPRETDEAWRTSPRRTGESRPSPAEAGRHGRCSGLDQRGEEDELVKIFHASDLECAKRATAAFLRKFGDEFPTACEVLARDLEDCLTFYRFPEAHWKRIRTSNIIERAFKEVRRRTKVVGRFPNEKSALTLVWASIEHDRLKWRGVPGSFNRWVLRAPTLPGGPATNPL